MSHEASLGGLSLVHEQMRAALRQSDFDVLQDLDTKRAELIKSLESVSNKPPHTQDIQQLARLVEEDTNLQAELSQRMTKLRQNHGMRLKAFGQYR